MPRAERHQRIDELRHQARQARAIAVLREYRGPGYYKECQQADCFHGVYQTGDEYARS